MPVEVDVEGKTLSLSNLDKVLYPKTGFTKSQVIDYYARISKVMVPHLKRRCITTKRWPDGVEAESFFQKNCPKFHPDWIQVADGPGDSDTVSYCLVETAAAMVWMANLAALEFHAPMAFAGDLETPSMIVFDLDPGQGVGLIECCKVALGLKELLENIKLKCFAKTSGGKGMQVYIPINQPDISHKAASAFAKSVGDILAKQLDGLVITNMKRSLRDGKVFIDWSQNSRHKTTVAVYSLRGREQPFVSTPITWDEVELGANSQLDLKFLPNQVLQRVETFGDLFESALIMKQYLKV